MRRPSAGNVTDRESDGEGSRLAWQALVEQQARLRQAARRLHAARAADVHDARVAARRLRSLLSTWRPLFDQRRSQPLRRRIREFARALSGARDADVRRDLLLSAAGRVPSVAADDLRVLRTVLRRDRAESRRSLRAVLASADWAESVDVLCDQQTLVALRLRPDAGLAELLELVDQPWRDANRLLASRLGGVAKLHRLRLALKRCRYALEPVSSLQPGRAARTIDRLRSLQDSLGEHRDAVAARQWLETHQALLGCSLTQRLDQELRLIEKQRKADVLRRATGLMPAYAKWRTALRGLRAPLEASRDPGSP